MINKTDYRVFKWLTWLFIGIIISYVCSAMLISGSISITDFYSDGKVYEIRQGNSLVASTSQGDYQPNNKEVILDDEGFECTFTIVGNKNKWNYLCIKLDKLSKQTFQGEISYEVFGEENIKEESAILLKSGMNIIEVPDNNFNVIVMRVLGETDDSFVIKNVQLRSEKPIFSMKKAITYFGISFVVYLFISMCLWSICKKSMKIINLYCWVEVLQNLYIQFAEQFVKITHKFLGTEKRKNYLRRCSFLAIFLYSTFVDIKGIYTERFKYNLIVYLSLILLIAISSVNGKLKKKQWNNPLVWSWIILWIMACVSDFIIIKNYRFIGYVMIIVVGFYFFVWNNMDKPEQMLEDFTIAVHLYLLAMTLFCLLCRPNTMGMRYSGFSKNPSVFALCLGTVWAVVLGELECRIKKNSSFKNVIIYIVEICIVFSFMWKSQSAGPLLCAGVLSISWFYRMLKYTVEQKIHKKLVYIIIAIGFLIIPIYVSVTWGIDYLPHKLGTTVTFEGEAPTAKLEFSSTVYAAEESVSRLEQKFSNTTLSDILSGRDYYYKAYIREMNLFGHKKAPVMWGKRRLPHNAILSIAYRYGVFASVPYVLMLLAVVMYTYRYSKKAEKYVSIPFYVCVSTIVMSMSDNIEQPFVWLPWFGLYILMGSVFITDKNEDYKDNINTV